MKGAIYDLAGQVDTLNNNSDVSWNITAGSVFMGTCHTFQYSKKLLADMVTEGVVFGLDPSLSYRIMLHDPNFYLLASNPLVFPRIWVEYKVVQNTIKKNTKYKDYYYYDCRAPNENLQKKIAGGYNGTWLFSMALHQLNKT